MSGKNECFLKCQGNVREFLSFKFVSNDEKHFGYKLNHFDSF